MAVFEHAYQAMGSTFRLRIDSWENLTTPLTSTEARSLFQSLQDETEAIEQALSRFRSSSELTMLNEHIGVPHVPSRHMREVLTLAQTMMQRTSGAFDPRILPAMEQIGYEGAPIHPISATRSVKTMHGPITLFEKEDEQTITIFSPIDLGGIGKGYTADILAKLIELCAESSKISGYIVDAGGDIVLSGCQHTGEAWTIGVEDPLNPQALKAAITPPLLNTQRWAICTSSLWRHSWKKDGKTVHHLIDPQTNQPVETPRLSVTAMAETAVLAETITKYVLLRGMGESPFWQYANPTFLCIDRSGQMTMTEALAASVSWMNTVGGT